MGPETILLITTPNLLSLKVCVHSFLGKQRIHPDHTLGFTFSLLETLFNRYGLHIIKWLSSAERFSSHPNRLANFVFDHIFPLGPRYADTIILLAKRAA